MDLRQEFRYTLRALLRRKGFTAVVVATLALGIGAATAIYSVVWWQVFRQVPVPPRVYAVGTGEPNGTVSPWIPDPLVAAYLAPSATIERCGLASYHARNVFVDGAVASASVINVDPGLFAVLEVKASLGRLFRPEEYLPGKDAEAVVSYRFWHRHLGGRPEALGRAVQVGRERYTVVGVLPQGLRLPVQASADVYHPYTFRFEPDAGITYSQSLFVRLTAGTTPAQATAALAGARVDLPAKFGDWYKKLAPKVISVAAAEKSFRRDAYLTLVGAVGFLYVIAVINATNLMLGQLLSRRRELAVRLALGSSRAAVVRLVVMESTLLTLAGTAGGIALGNWLTPLFFFLANRDGARDWLGWHLGAGAFAVLGLLALVTAVSTSLVPAVLMARTDAQAGLRAAAGSGGENPSLRRLRDGFVVLQTAMAVILLVGAGLLSLSFQRMAHLSLGFEPSHRVKVLVDLPPDAEANAAKTFPLRVATFERIRNVLLRVPGAVTAATSSASLLAGYEAMTQTIKGPDGTDHQVAVVAASSDYGQAAGLTLLAGTWFGPAAKDEVVINQTLARAQFPGRPPVGLYLKDGSLGKEAGSDRVVGVVADVRERIHEAPKPTIYRPISKNPWMAGAFVIEFHQVPDQALLAQIRTAIITEDPDIIVYDLLPLDAALDKATYDEHLAFSVFRVLSGIALALTLVGLFSIIAYSVDRRMGEFAIRMAVGATPGRLLSGILQRGILLVAAGVVLGSAGAFVLTRFIQKLLFDTPAFDGMVTAAISLLLLGTTLLACLPAARRASRPDLSSLLKQVG